MTAKQVNVYEAKTHLSKLLEQVEAGEEIVITIFPMRPTGCEIAAGYPCADLVAGGRCSLV
jgi:hypothetical protein